MAATDGRPVPEKNVAYRVTFPILDADGDLVTGATGLDSEVSIDGAGFSDVTAEATEIATSSGMYFLDLTAAEMNGDTIAIIVQTSTGGAKTTPIVMYPEEAGDIRVNVTEWIDTTVPAPSTAGVPDVNTVEFLDTAVVLSNGLPDINVEDWLGVVVATPATGGIPSVNPTEWAGGAIPAQSVTGVPEVDVTHFVATLAPTPATTGVPDVNTIEFLDTAVVLSNGLPDINVENWLGTIVTAATAGRPDVNTQAIDDNANAAAVLSDKLQDGVVGTADSGSTTSITDAARTEADDRFNGWMIVITSGASAGQSRLVTEFANTGGVITFAPAVTVSLTTETYVIIPQAGVDIQSWLGTEAAMVAPNALVGGAVDADVSGIQADVITAASIASNAIGASELATDAIGDDQIATGAIATTAFAAGAIDAAAIATDAIGSAELATTAVNEIRDAILSDSISFAGANIDAAITTRATPAQVNTEVLDVMNVDTITLPGQVAPPLTPTHRQAIGHIYKAYRNRKEQSSTLWRLFADNETTVDQQATVSDDGTDAVKQEIVVGV